MKKAVFLIIMSGILLGACRPSANRQSKTEASTTAGMATGIIADSGSLDHQSIDIIRDKPYYIRNHDKSQELLDALGESYQTNPPGVVGFTIESKNAPEYIDGIYLNDDGILIIQVTGDTLMAKEELKRVIGTEGYFIEHITQTSNKYSQKQLLEINNQLRRRVEELEGNPVLANLMGFGAGISHVNIFLILNSPEKQLEFREKIMDSPAFFFEGSEAPMPTPVIGVNDTLGVFLRPEYTAYSTKTDQVKFILYNRSGKNIESGAEYFITYEDVDGIWRELPINKTFISIGYGVGHNKELTINANLHPEVNNNKPGRYRFFYNLRIDGYDSMLFMSGFQLTDKLDKGEHAQKTPAIGPSPIDATEYFGMEDEHPENELLNVVEVMPEYPDNGSKGCKEFIAKRIPEKFAKEGAVIVQFVVEKDGSLSNYRIIRSLGKEQDEASIRILQEMPKWIPGTLQGEPVRVKYTLAVDFR